MKFSSKWLGHPPFMWKIRDQIPVNFINIFIWERLLLKPYAFTARPWELKSVYSLDILDGVCSKIRLDIRGVNIMRILPVVYKYLNEEWITDKIRFSYDAFE